MDSLLSPPVAKVLAGIGLLFVASKVFSLVRLFASYFLIPGKSVRTYLPAKCEQLLMAI